MDIPERHDFDFIHGRWTVAHRKLKARGVGCDEWDTFASTSRCEPRLGGLANIEEMDCPARGWMGMAVRTLDVESRAWSIRWADSRDGVLGPPVSGRFTSDGCVLEGPDTCGGRPVIARFIWSEVRTGRPRWTQAFSYDGGLTWETNWIMDFTRAE